MGTTTWIWMTVSFIYIKRGGGVSLMGWIVNYSCFHGLYSNRGLDTTNITYDRCDRERLSLQIYAKPVKFVSLFSQNMSAVKGWSDRDKLKYEKKGCIVAFELYGDFTIRSRRWERPRQRRWPQRAWPGGRPGWDWGRDGTRSQRSGPTADMSQNSPIMENKKVSGFKNKSKIF